MQNNGLNEWWKGCLVQKEITESSNIFTLDKVHKKSFQL